MTAASGGGGFNFWFTVKDLYGLLDAAVVRRSPGIRPDLESSLNRHKKCLVNLLQNPVRTTADADAVKKSCGPEGSRIPDLPSRIPSSAVEEALIVSDMFGLNEVVSLELILAAESRLCDHPGLSRGLVAVLLYYDGRKTLVDSLKAVILGSQGLAWTLGTSPDVADLLTTFTADLVSGGLVANVLNLLKDTNWAAELNKLEKNMALGDARHRHQVREYFRSIEIGLAECLFAVSAQRGLSGQDVLKLVNYLSKVKLEQSNADGSLSDVDMALVMALLYSIDVSRAEQVDDLNGVLKIPLLADPEAVPNIHRELDHSSTRQWNHEGIGTLVKFGWSMTLATMRSTGPGVPPNVQPIIDDDEFVMDASLGGGVFHWLSKCVLLSPSIAKEEFYVRRLHGIVTDLILHMPLKVKELRNRADDAARNKLMHEQEGIRFAVPLQAQHFEQLLAVISKLYSIHLPNLNLVLDYWLPVDGNAGSGTAFPPRRVALYKFVRLAGDLLMPSLYSPYVEMLASLARNQEASLHCFNLLKVQGQGQAGIVSWDHFFGSLHQYFHNLENRGVAAADTIYRPLRPMTKGISPDEIQGLAAVLRLITAVSDNCEQARLAFAQKSEWQAVLVLIGLVGCSVPAMLKAELLKTLTSLSKSPELAVDVWNNFEPFLNPKNGAGFVTELEAEGAVEEYPLTLAFLNFMDVMLESRQVDDLENLVSFDNFNRVLVDDIFLRFRNRSYKISSQKWEVCRASLKIINRLIDEAPADQLISSKPESLVAQHLHQPTELLKLVLSIFEEATELIFSFEEFPGIGAVEESSLQVLKILSKSLGLQDRLLGAARDGNSGSVFIGLDKLLLGVSARSGRADRLVGVARYWGWFDKLPDHAVAAVKIVDRVATAANQSAILGQLTAVDADAKDIIKSVTDIIDSAASSGDEGVDKEARVGVLELMIKCVDFPGPNLAHFLLGFDLSPGAEPGMGSGIRANIRPPGMPGVVRSPLHAMTSLLMAQQQEEAVPDELFVVSHPHSAESMFKLIFRLCFNPDTTGPTLRYLHSVVDHFFLNQIRRLPVPSGSVEVVRSQSWMMKGAAIQLRNVCRERLRSQLSSWINLLLSPDQEMNQDDVPNDLRDLNQLSHSGIHARKVGAGRRSHNRLLTILNSIDFSEKAVDPPQLEIFDADLVNAAMNRCRIGGGNLIDVAGKLHGILRQEVGSVHGNTATAQRQIINEEVNRILRYAVDLNMISIEMESRKTSLDGWRQIAEVILISGPPDILPNSSKQQTLLELLQTLLNKVLAEGASLELAGQVSGIVLLLLKILKETYSSAPGDGKDRSFVPILDSTSSGSAAGRVYPTALQTVLKGLLTWISTTPGQRVRVNLYGALLNYLRIGKGHELESLKLRKANVEVINGFGDVLIDIVCRDTASGHDVRRILALGVLDEVTGTNGGWMWYVSREGYLKHIIETLVSSDGDLVDLLRPESKNQKSLFGYEAKMSFLTRMACSVAGAELLLESGLMVRLSEMKVFSLCPEMVGHYRSATSGLETVYRSVLFPALRLCQSLLACLGNDNVSAATHVRHFVKANEDVFRTVLQNPHADLEEVTLITGVMAKAGDDDQLSMLKRQMLSLLCHYNGSGGSGGDVKVAHNLHAFAREVATSGMNRVKCRILFSPNSGQSEVVLSGRPLSIGQVVGALESFMKVMKNFRSGDFEFKLLGSSVESTLWLLWKHVEHFVKTDDSGCSDFRTVFTDDTFFQLLDVDKRMMSQGSNRFIESLVRRLKRTVSNL